MRRCVTVVSILTWCAVCCASCAISPAPSTAVDLRETDRAASNRLDTDFELLERVEAAFQAIENGQREAAEREIDEMVSRFPQDRSAELFALFLENRLESIRASSASDGPTTVRQRWRAVREFLRADDLLSAGDSARALEALERAYFFDPANEQVEEMLIDLLKKEGLAAYSKGDCREALTSWTRVLEIRPRDAEALEYSKRAEVLLEKTEGR